MLAALGYGIAHGPEIGCGQPGAERNNWAQVVFDGRLRQALARLNPKVPAFAREEAFRKLKQPESPSLVAGNHAMHRLIVEGVPVEYPRPDGSLEGANSDAVHLERGAHHLRMKNPTIVVITDRNDLDDQLFGTFARCQELLRQGPVQAESRGQLRDLLKTDSGGVIFTTVHKFFPTADEAKFPLLSERRNVVVMADEAHRSQYDFVDGFAGHMRSALPGASFIGFTGTPIEKADANTRAVFGNYVGVYDVERAVKDGATVPIYYESRLAKLALDDRKKPKLDADAVARHMARASQGRRRLGGRKHADDVRQDRPPGQRATVAALVALLAGIVRIGPGPELPAGHGHEMAGKHAQRGPASLRRSD